MVGQMFSFLFIYLYLWKKKTTFPFIAGCTDRVKVVIRKLRLQARVGLTVQPCPKVASTLAKFINKQRSKEIIFLLSVLILHQILPFHQLHLIAQ